MRVPTRSAGTRSGVNWRRRNVPPSTSATVLTVSVLARPGTPSSSTWPPVSSATSTRSSIASWPTTTRLHSYSAASRSRRASAAGSISGWVMGVVPRVWGSDEPPAQADRGQGRQDHQHQAAAGEEARHLALAPDGRHLGAEPLVDLV